MVAEIIMVAVAAALTPASAQPKLSYVLTVTPEVGQSVSATLKCEPSGGTHPHKRKACKQLSKAQGRVENIPPQDGVCTAEYAPVTVRAESVGYLYEKTFSNECTAILQTGGYLFKLRPTS